MRRGSPGRTMAVITVGVLLLATAGRAQWSGRPLVEALEELRERGLPLVYSTSVVRPDLRILDEPEEGKPRRMLDSFLAPHGLEAVPGAGGRILIVPDGRTGAEAARLGRVRGRVLGPGAVPRTRVKVTIPRSVHEAITDGAGRFVLPGVPEGRHTVVAILPGGNELEQEVRVEASKDVSVLFHAPDLTAPVQDTVVVSSMSLFDREPAASVSFGESEVEAVPHFGDDLFRAVRLLPGVIGNDLEAGLEVRGSPSRELLVRLDGLELHEPYHLRDLEGVLSIIDPEVVERVDLMAGTFPAEFGDRSAGVLDLKTSRPEEGRGRLGLSLATSWAGASGLLEEDRLSWLASARRGYVDLALDLAGEDEAEAPRPSYWDLFGKIDYQISDGNRLSLNFLSADDGIFLEDQDQDSGDVTRADTAWRNRHFWLRHVGILSPRILAETDLSVSALDRDRRGFHRDKGLSSPDELVSVRDRRTLELFDLREGWSIDPAARHLLKAGFEVRAFDVAFDYVDEVVRAFPIDDPRFEPGVDASVFREDFDGVHWGVWASDRVRISPGGTVELGLRWDTQTLTDQDQISPRLNGVWDLESAGRLRAGWGYFFQSQRPHELEVQFGEKRHQGAQRAEQLTLGWERDLSGLGMLRIEAYRKRITDPLRRYETLFDPVQPIPQIALDLVKIEPTERTSQGLEISLRGRSPAGHGWWGSYIWSRSRDRIDGDSRPRWNDQPHAIDLGSILHLSPRWTLAAVWRYHTGWPTTEVAAEAFIDPGGQVELTYDVGPFYQKRWPPYHRLDLRLSRTSLLRRGRLKLFLDVQNLYDRENVRGLEIWERRFVPTEEGGLRVDFETLHWLGFVPSFGIEWEF